MSFKIKYYNEQDKNDVLTWSGGSYFQRWDDGKEVMGFTCYAPDSYPNRAPCMSEALEIMKDHFDLINKGD